MWSIKLEESRISHWSLEYIKFVEFPKYWLKENDLPALGLGLANHENLSIHAVQDWVMARLRSVVRSGWISLLPGDTFTWRKVVIRAGHDADAWRWLGSRKDGGRAWRHAETRASDFMDKVEHIGEITPGKPCRNPEIQSDNNN